MIRYPFPVDVQAGQTYWWCRCGRSGRQPFCDGSHKGSEFTPLQYTALESQKLWFCGCKQTRSPPLCDGTHKTLGAAP
jgi:CDGSH-type Zn-finger protein